MAQLLTIALGGGASLLLFWDGGGSCPAKSASFARPERGLVVRLVAIVSVGGVVAALANILSIAILRRADETP